jgi:prophage maintenance system killer protein
MENTTENKGEIVIYKADSGPELLVKLENETIWLSQAQMARLFDRDTDTIGDHIQSIYKTAELSQNQTTGKFPVVQTEGKKQVRRDITFYNLDMIISVGYRVNSKRGTQFRIWATKHLRDYLLKGYLINEKRLKENEEVKLKELQQAVGLMQQALEVKRLEGYEKDLLNIITDYANTWLTLYKFDTGNLDLSGKKSSVTHLDYEKVKKSIERFKVRLMKDKEASELFGSEVSEKLLSLLGNVRQSLGGKDVYPTLEEKAAHILYFAVKDHPFVDGNKRIGALLFILFLVENHFLINKKGERKINDSALTALTLLIAESKPTQKHVMVKLIVNLINKK